MRPNPSSFHVKTQDTKCRPTRPLGTNPSAGAFIRSLPFGRSHSPFSSPHFSSLYHARAALQSLNGMASSSSPLKLIIISILLLSFTLFPLLFPPKPLSNTPSKSRLLLESSSPPPDAPCSGVRRLPADLRCDAAFARCRGDSHGLLNYAAVHFCLLAGDPCFSLPALSLLLLLHFYFLVSTARDHFSPVVTRLAAHLRLSPSMAAVTLLALGNGSPDVFASVAAVRGGHARTGLGAILSAGAFVSAFVVGAVAVLAGPFPLNPGPFVRDVFFYLIAASALFYVYLSAEIFLWQAVGFILFYLFFVGFVFWMDFVVEGRRAKEAKVEMALVVEEAPNKPSKQVDWESGEVMGDLGDAKARSACSLYWMLGKVRIERLNWRFDYFRASN